MSILIIPDEAELLIANQIKSTLLDQPTTYLGVFTNNVTIDHLTVYGSLAVALDPPPLSLYVRWSIPATVGGKAQNWLNTAVSLALVGGGPVTIYGVVLYVNLSGTYTVLGAYNLPSPITLTAAGQSITINTLFYKDYDANS